MMMIGTPPIFMIIAIVTVITMMTSSHAAVAAHARPDDGVAQLTTRGPRPMRVRHTILCVAVMP
jgi:hypothetical protein